MNAKQFERRVRALEEMLSKLESRLFGVFLHYATKEELETLAKEFRAVPKGTSLPEETRKKTDAIYARMLKRAKDSSRPHSRKLIPKFPLPTDAV